MEIDHRFVMIDEASPSRMSVVSGTIRPSSTVRQSQSHGGGKRCVACGKCVVAGKTTCSACVQAECELEVEAAEPIRSVASLTLNQQEDAERARRLAYYGDRAAKRLPLFSDLANAPFPVADKYK